MIPFLLLFPLLANAYTWQFTSQPRQCQNLSLAVQGSGQPPYSLLIIPTGPTPLPNNTEVRLIQNIPFPGSSTTLSFKLDYPENSSFVAVVSSYFTPPHFLTHVTPHYRSVTKAVLAPVAPALRSPFSNHPTRVVTMPLRPRKSTGSSASILLADSLNANRLGCGGNSNLSMGTSLHQSSVIRRALTSFGYVLPCRSVSFYGTIPGGTSFLIPQGSVSTNNNTGTGFNWTVDITGGTNVLLIGNDDRGIGSGGSAAFTISYATNNSCLDSNSPSSTAGSPAGGSYPTSTSGSSTGNDSHSSS
jgi:hypothetical protein